MESGTQVLMTTRTECGVTWGGGGMEQGQHRAQRKLAEPLWTPRSSVKPGTELSVCHQCICSSQCHGNRGVTHSKEARHWSLVKGDNREASGALASNS